MKLEIFAVHDVKADAYLPPFYLPRVPMAQRVFADCIHDPKHQFGANPADYTLFHLGAFDDNLGLLMPFESAVNLGNGLTFIKSVDVEA